MVTLKVTTDSSNNYSIAHMLKTNRKTYGKLQIHIFTYTECTYRVDKSICFKPSLALSLTH